MTEERYDVVVCGGGLAGLTFARHIRQTLPDLAVLVLEKQQRPLPQAAYKVGESTIEAGTYYYADVLGLRDYLEHEHLYKLGLRYFYGGHQEDFASRPEWGLSEFPAADSFQLDRGALETHLREIVLRSGVRLIEGASIFQIELGEDGADHCVSFNLPATDLPQAARGRWLIDASVPACRRPRRC